MEANFSKRKKISIFQIISILIFILCFFGTVYYMRTHIKTIIDSDDSSEMILGKILSEEDAILTENWYYSTELRVLQSNVIFSLLFRVTNRWYRVRLYSSIIMYAILLISYYGMSIAYNFKKYFFISAAVFLIPFSSEYFLYVLKGLYYLPFIVYMMLIMSLSENIMKSNGRKKQLLLVVAFLLSVMIGLIGAREILVLFLPLLAAALCSLLLSLRSSRQELEKWLIYAAIVFLGAIIGLLLNMSVLQNRYNFSSWDNAVFNAFSINRIQDIINAILFSYGYQIGSIGVVSIIRNILCAAWLLATFLSVFYALKNRKKVSGSYYRFAIFTVSAFLIFIIFYGFIWIYIDYRHCLPIIVLSIPLISMCLKEIKWKENISEMFFIGMVVMTMLSGTEYYFSQWNYRPSADINRVARELISLGYQNGYATFWNGNILTELSDGQIDVWHLCLTSDELKEIKDINHTFHWLQRVSHDTTHPKGKTFILFTTEENNNNNWQENLKPDQIIIQTGSYVVYGFESYDDLIANLYS